MTPVDASAGDQVFFLGGRDLEMQAIRELLEEHAPERFHDSELPWHQAKASRYREAIGRALDDGRVPVLVELEDDLGLDPQRIVSVDHHGHRAGRGRSTALEQVFELLELPPASWDRRLELVAANDRAYLAGLREAGASREEMERIRHADRRAQGITDPEERQARDAVGALERRCGGRLLIARLPHAKTAPLVDRLAPELGGPGFENLFVRSPHEVNVFATGDVVEHLAATFLNAWYGGNLPDHGYFGRPGTGDEVLRVLEAFLGAKSSNSPP